MVADALGESGARVFAPTCSGLGERAHLLAPGIDHRTFVQDVMGVIEAEELDDVILVGHSFGGVVISGVADRMPARIRHLVYLDSIIPTDGRSPMDCLPSAVAAARIEAAHETSGGLTIPVPPPSAFGIEPGPLDDWVARRLTPQPLASYTEPVHFAGPVGGGLPRTYVFCNNPAHPSVGPSWEWVRSQPGWTIRTLATCHDPMVTEPRLVTELLLEIAG